MPIAYEQVGRTSQKHRTRTALVAAARELLAHHIHHHHADGIAGQFAQILPDVCWSGSPGAGCSPLESVESAVVSFC
jgi:hypothetical protein